MVFKRGEAAVPHVELLATVMLASVRNSTKVQNFLLPSHALCDLRRSLL